MLSKKVCNFPLNNLSVEYAWKDVSVDNDRDDTTTESGTLIMIKEVFKKTLSQNIFHRVWSKFLTIQTLVIISGCHFLVNIIITIFCFSP